MSLCGLKTAVVNPRKCKLCKKSFYKTKALNIEFIQLQRANLHMKQMVSLVLWTRGEVLLTLHANVNLKYVSLLLFSQPFLVRHKHFSLVNVFILSHIRAHFYAASLGLKCELFVARSLLTPCCKYITYL